MISTFALCTPESLLSILHPSLRPLDLRNTPSILKISNPPTIGSFNTVDGVPRIGLGVHITLNKSHRKISDGKTLENRFEDRCKVCNTSKTILFLSCSLDQKPEEPETWLCSIKLDSNCFCTHDADTQNL